jgi:hypothetical protein
MHPVCCPTACIRARASSLVLVVRHTCGAVQRGPPIVQRTLVHFHVPLLDEELHHFQLPTERHTEESGLRPLKKVLSGPKGSATGLNPANQGFNSAAWQGHAGL